MISIQKSLSPILETSSFDKYVLVKDLSVGEIETRELCMDTRMCATVTGAVIRDETTILYTYPEYGTYLAKLTVLDTFGNSQSKRATLELTPPATGQVGLLSIPQPIAVDSGVYEISVGRALDYEVTMYVVAPEGECGVDLDITVDEDSDGDPTNDSDVECNQLYTQKFEPRAHEQWAKIWMSNNGVTT